MARSLRIQYEGALYHVTSRGNARKKIFFTHRDYEKFKEYVAQAREKFDFYVHCYVLMSNHYHILLEVPDKGLSKILHHINSSYSIYLNTKRTRSGHVFQGRFKAIIVDKDSYLAELSRYIHLNPVRAKMVTKPEDYIYSSYRAYVFGADDLIAHTASVLSLFSEVNSRAQSSYKRYVESSIASELENPFASVYGGGILGNEDFVNEVLANIEKRHLHNEDVAHRKTLIGRTKVDAVLALLSEHLGESVDEITRRGGHRRKICVYLLKRYSDATNKAISLLLGIATYSAAAKIYQRFLKELELDPALKQEVERLEAEMSLVQVRPHG
jgi:putative transposase